MKFQTKERLYTVAMIASLVFVCSWPVSGFLVLLFILGLCNSL